MAAALRWEGFSDVEAWIRSACERSLDDFSYLTLADRSERESEESLGRWDRPALAALGEHPFNGQVGVGIGPADQACSWLRETAASNAIGSARTAFRVRAWSRKGGGSWGSRGFVVYDDAALPVGTITPAQAESHATATGLRTLGDHYAQFVGLVLGAFRDLAAIYRQNAGTDQEECKALRAQVQELFAAHLNAKGSTDETAALIEVERRNAEVRGKIASDTITTLKDIGEALVFGRDKDSVAILKVLEASPELAPRLRDPKMLDLLREPSVQKGLAEILDGLVTPDPPAPDNGGKNQNVAIAGEEPATKE